MRKLHWSFRFLLIFSFSLSLLFLLVPATKLSEHKKSYFRRIGISPRCDLMLSHVFVYILRSTCENRQRFSTQSFFIRIASHSIMTLFWQNDNLIYVNVIHINFLLNFCFYFCALTWCTKTERENEKKKKQKRSKWLLLGVYCFVVLSIGI